MNNASRTVAVTAFVSAILSASPAMAEDGARVYELYCAMCHSNNMMGAPRYGEKKEWRDRLAQGDSVLIEHALKGFNKMPAKGGNGGLSDDDVKAATAHLLKSVK